VLETIVRVNNPGDFRPAMIGNIKRKWLVGPLAKIGAQKCAQPCPSTFGDGKDDGVAVGEICGATTEIPSAAQHACEFPMGAGFRPA
jgi:hypothetical protein